MNPTGTKNRTARRVAAKGGGANPWSTDGEVQANNVLLTTETATSIHRAFARRRASASRSRLGRVAAATASTLLLSLGIAAAPAHAMRWTRGTVSPYVVDCRSGTVCMRAGQIDWVETCRQFRDQHETFCEAEGM